MVYVMYYSPYEWDRVSGPSLELAKKLLHGVPLQQSDIPQESRFTGRFKMPDISVPTGDFFCVSDVGRAALEELAPGCSAYFALNMQLPAKMKPAKAYWYVEVIARARCIDWDRSQTQPRIVRAADGRESRALTGSFRFAKMKVLTPDVPPIWRELDDDRPRVNFFNPKNDIFMRDELWDALNARFPGQLQAIKVGEQGDPIYPKHREES